jgi:hypothetical protein
MPETELEVFSEAASAEGVEHAHRDR